MYEGSTASAQVWNDEELQKSNDPPALLMVTPIDSSVGDRWTKAHRRKQNWEELLLCVRVKFYEFKIATSTVKVVKVQSYWMSSESQFSWSSRLWD